MPRHTLVTIAALAFTLLASTASAAAPFTADLQHGVRANADVQRLQEFLTAQQLYSGPITGNFFSLTLRAVKAFQAREGITPAAGYFGPRTRVRANALLSAAGTSTPLSKYQQLLDETQARANVIRDRALNPPPSVRLPSRSFK